MPGRVGDPIVVQCNAIAERCGALEQSLRERDTLGARKFGSSIQKAAIASSMDAEYVGPTIGASRLPL